MQTDNRYDVRILGFEGGAQEDWTAGLMDVFGVDESFARQITERMPVTVKRAVTEEIAQRYFEALRSLGARVELRPQHAQRSQPPLGTAALPSVPAPRSAVPVALPSVPAPTVPALGEPDERSLLKVLGGAFLYPLQKRGLPILAGLALFSQVFGTFAGMIPLIGWFLWLLFYWGPILAYLFTVIGESAAGREEMPAYPQIDSVWDFFIPLAKYALAIVVAWGPCVAVLLLTSTSDLSLVATGVLGLLGLFYLPASIMITSIGTGCFTPLNVVGGIQLIARLPKPYAVLVLFSAGPVALDIVLGTIASPIYDVIPSEFAAGLVATLISLYPAVIAMRMYGIFLSRYEEDLMPA